MTFIHRIFLFVCILFGLFDYINSSASIISRSDYSPTKTLADLAKDGDLFEIKKLLRRGFDIDQRDANGFTALLNAVAYNHYAIVRYLLLRGADVNVRNDENDTALHLALNHERDGIARLLIESGANVNATDRFSWALLHWAAKNYDYDMMKFLIEKGANVNAADGENTPLIATISMYSRAARSIGRLVEMVEFLIRNGANVNAVDQDGMTALHVAAREGFAEVVDTLLQHGADRKKKNGDNKTSRDLAVERKNEKGRFSRYNEAIDMFNEVTLES